MLSFKEFVKEEYKITKSNDQDFPDLPEVLLVFSEKEPDEYTVRGKTHGTRSHAIKHMSEFNSGYAASVAKKVLFLIADKLKEDPDFYCRIWTDGIGFIGKPDMPALRSSNVGIIMNTLDMINDKIELGEKLLPIEQEIRPIVDEMGKKYMDILISKVRKSTHLEEGKTKEEYKKIIMRSSVIDFEGVSSQGMEINYWIDFNDGTVIIGTGNSFRSMYILNSSINKGSIMRNFLRKAKPKDENLLAAFQDMKG